MKILLIEDDKRLARLIKSVLEEEKYSLDLQYDGELGLELALSGLHDLVIVDWMLPGRDGPSICRKIRSCETIRANFDANSAGSGRRSRGWTGERCR